MIISMNIDIESIGLLSLILQDSPKDRQLILCILAQSNTVPTRITFSPNTEYPTFYGYSNNRIPLYLMGKGVISNVPREGYAKRLLSSHYLSYTETVINGAKNWDIHQKLMSVSKFITLDNKTAYKDAEIFLVFRDKALDYIKGYTTSHQEELSTFLGTFNKEVLKTEVPVKQAQLSTSQIESLYKKIAEVDEQIRLRREAWAKAQSTISDNPFYAEATRTGHLAKLEQQAQTDIGNFVKQKETYLTELSLRKSDAQISESSQVQSDPQKQKANASYDPQKGVLDIEGKKVKFKKESFRAKLLELLLKDDKSSRKEWSWDEVIEKIEDISDPDLLKEYKKKFYPACDGLSKQIASKTGITDFLTFTKSTVQINAKYL